MLESNLQNHRSALYRYLFRFTGDEDLAEDSLQETFERIYRYYHTFNPERASFYTWAARIARNIHFRHRQKNCNLPPLYLEDLPPLREPRAVNGEILEGEMLAEEIRQVVFRLPEPERSIILIKQIGKVGLKETAAELQLSTRSVSRRLLRALSLIRGELGKLGISAKIFD